MDCTRRSMVQGEEGSPSMKHYAGSIALIALAFWSEVRFAAWDWDSTSPFMTPFESSRSASWFSGSWWESRPRGF